MVSDTTECCQNKVENYTFLGLQIVWAENNICGMEAWTTFTDSCEDCDVILIEVVWRRQEGEFSKANFSPTQCRFSGFFRVEKTFLPVLWSSESISVSTYFWESRFRVDLDVTPGQANLCKQDICTEMRKLLVRRITVFNGT